MRYTTGDRYFGNYKLNVAWGAGQYEFANGDKYEGYFKDNLMHGAGVYTYANGDVYEGKFRKGVKCDTCAKFKYQNGDVYEGRFDDNKPVLHGTLTSARDREKVSKVSKVYDGKLIEVDHHGEYTNYNEAEAMKAEEEEYYYSTSESESDNDDADSLSLSTMQTGITTAFSRPPSSLK
jgi:hypothetical protein